jgi:hypothetical protein
MCPPTYGMLLQQPRLQSNTGILYMAIQRYAMVDCESRSCSNQFWRLLQLDYYENILGNDVTGCGTVHENYALLYLARSHAWIL